jgi:hypothetical protein
MMPLLHGLVLVSAAAGNALAASVWQGTILAACVWLCLRLLPAVSAAARSLVWMGVFGVVLALHFGPSAQAAVGRQAGAGAIHVGLGWSLALTSVWGLLTLVRAGQFAVSAWHLWGVARRAVPVELGFVAPAIGRHYQVCTSAQVDRPSAVGFLRPRVLLPQELAQRLTQGELEQVLLHEAEHLRRRDDWTNLLQKLALVVFPLHPVLLWVERRLCLERELACDDSVLRAVRRPGAAKAYAACLTNLAEHRMVRRGISLALGAWERHSELARRVHRILRRRESRMAGGAVRLATGGLILGLVAGGIELAHAPELVSFGPAAPIESGGMGQAAASFAGPLRVRMAERNGAPASAKLVKAVMPSSASHAAVSAMRPVRSVAKRAAMKQRPAEQQPRMIVTGWRAGQTQGRVILSLLGGSRVSYTVVPAVVRVPAYAALPVSNGWIVFQL